MNLGALTLENRFVRLRPFAAGPDGPELYALAERAPEIFRLWSHRGPGDWVGAWIEVIRRRTESGTMIPFTVTRPEDGAFLGITSFLDPSEGNKSLEVGMTCYAPEAQGTVINPACKRLLMAHAFEDWGARRVQYQVDNRNERSKAAVLKLGAKLEGVLRKHKTLPDGFVRDTAFFSILDTEWPEVKARLDARLLAAEAARA
ncbi:GNAT family N-acetyltransferase [Hyphomonas sp. NPDC076900]|uniref:GNAT family N-acetyltransferase n=1 Tax=unclassified Hyphomonas TaxID=2630699 RepID=UPI003CFDAF90